MSTVDSLLDVIMWMYLYSTIGTRIFPRVDTTHDTKIPGTLRRLEQRDKKSKGPLEPKPQLRSSFRNRNYFLIVFFKALTDARDKVDMALRCRSWLSHDNSHVDCWSIIGHNCSCGSIVRLLYKVH